MIKLSREGTEMGDWQWALVKILDFAASLSRYRRMHGFIAHITDAFGMLAVRQNSYDVFYFFHKGINVLLPLLCPNKGPVP